MISIKKIKQELLRFYRDTGEELVGFIMPTSIVQVMNIHDKPSEGFLVDPSDVIRYVEEKGAVATWHTHPSAGSNLSGDDYQTFRAFSDLMHFVVGNDGVRCYKYDKIKQAIIEVSDE